MRKRLYHDLQHLISKQFAGDRAQPHDTISSNSADDRKRQIVDQDHQLALPWRACNHSPEIGSGLNCIGNNCDPLKALCFRPYNTSGSRFGRYSPEIFNPCLQQRRTNLGSRVALLPGKFLCVRKVFARTTEKNVSNCPNTFKTIRIFPDDFQFSRRF